MAAESVPPQRTGDPDHALQCPRRRNGGIGCSPARNTFRLSAVFQRAVGAGRDARTWPARQARDPYRVTRPLKDSKGILQSGKLWATEVRYMNDASELDYALEFARQELDKFLDEYPPSTSTRQKLAGQLRLALDSGETKWREDFFCFVACFCEEADLLSQWRGYGAGGGYAMGFDVAAWEQARKDLRFRPVRYDEEAYRQELHDRFRHLFAQENHVIEAWADHRDLWDIYNRGEVYGAISFDAPFRKHPGFKEERGWADRSPRQARLGKTWPPAYYRSRADSLHRVRSECRLISVDAIRLGRFESGRCVSRNLRSRPCASGLSTRLAIGKRR